jgi:hypothetical protein
MSATRVCAERIYNISISRLSAVCKRLDNILDEENNAKITKWLGHVVDGINAKHPEFGWYEIPDYSRVEYAITLLPVLVARGYGWRMTTFYDINGNVKFRLFYL